MLNILFLFQLAATSTRQHVNIRSSDHEVKKPSTSGQLGAGHAVTPDGAAWVVYNPRRLVLNRALASPDLQLLVACPDKPQGLVVCPFQSIEGLTQTEKEALVPGLALLGLAQMAAFRLGHPRPGFFNLLAEEDLRARGWASAAEDVLAEIRALGLEAVPAEFYPVFTRIFQIESKEDFCAKTSDSLREQVCAETERIPYISIESRDPRYKTGLLEDWLLHGPAAVHVGGVSGQNLARFMKECLEKRGRTDISIERDERAEVHADFCRLSDVFEIEAATAEKQRLAKSRCWAAVAPRVRGVCPVVFHTTEGVTLTDMHIAGSGRNGRVYVGHDKAVKVSNGLLLTSSMAEPVDPIDPFKTEIDAMIMLEAENVPDVPRFLGKLADSEGYVMTHFPGVPMDAGPIKCGDDGRCTPEDVERILEKIRDTFAKIHAINYVHGDAHIGNILVNKEGEVMVIDFDALEWVDTENIGSDTPIKNECDDLVEDLGENAKFNQVRTKAVKAIIERVFAKGCKERQVKPPANKLSRRLTIIGDMPRI